MSMCVHTTHIHTHTHRYEHAACVTTGGVLLAWGSNAENQLGQERGAATPLLASPGVLCSSSVAAPWFRAKGFGLRGRGAQEW